MSSVGEREAAIAQIVASDQATAALRQHLQAIVEGEAFRGSHRSAQFLAYIVERAIAGNFDSLKERMIGIELFGRSPAYDTSEDAIVRVTASDVRRRLLQHYGQNGDPSDFRISLPLGSYVPEITHSLPEAPSDRISASPRPPNGARSASGGVAQPEPALPAPLAEAVLPAPAIAASVSTSRPRLRWQLTAAAAALVLVNIAVWLFAWKRAPVLPNAPPPAALPWQVFFASSRPIHLVTSDPDIEGVQILTEAPISVSDYANHRYVPHPNRLSAEVEMICTDILHGDKASTVDAQITAEIAGMAQAYGHKIDVLGARDLQYSNLRTDDNFIFLGSPLSNPWVATFDQQLDFRFVPAVSPGQRFSSTEAIRNAHPRPGEPSQYLPTAKGGGTGESFAILALVGNPDQNGQVLLLAGANREGTVAAGRLATDPGRLTAALQQCGLSASSPIRHFEMLLRVDTMASYPTQSTLVACHLLSDPATTR